MKKMILAYILTVVWGIIFLMCTAGVVFVMSEWKWDEWNLWLCCIGEVMMGLVIGYFLNRLYERIAYGCKIFK